jgi:putative MFS transporter
MYKNIKGDGCSERQFHQTLHQTRNDFSNSPKCILIGLPTWFVVGVLVTFSDKFAEALGI